NAELKSVGHPGFKVRDVVDTLKIAREKFPGSPANLDALCRRFNIDNSGREFHGALLDSQLLAEVYLEMMGGRQHGLILQAEQAVATESITVSVQAGHARRAREKRLFPVSAEALEAHAELVSRLTDPIWVSDPEEARIH
ncbi:MAG TPA: exonuclease domain-containing protein, partial [Alphaproteobacteria bacterium]